MWPFGNDDDYENDPEPGLPPVVYMVAGTLLVVWGALHGGI